MASPIENQNIATRGLVDAEGGCAGAGVEGRGREHPPRNADSADESTTFLDSSGVFGLVGTPRPREWWWLVPRESQARQRGPERVVAGLGPPHVWGWGAQLPAGRDSVNPASTVDHGSQVAKRAAIAGIGFLG